MYGHEKGITEAMRTFRDTHPVRRWQRISYATLCLALLVPVLLAACGGNDNGNTPTATATSASGALTPTAAPENTPTTAPEAPSATPTTPPAPTTAPATPTSAPTSEPTSAPATPTAPTETLTLSVYFIRDEKVGTAHRVVPHTLQVAAAAMEALLAGPTEEEAAAGLTSAIPEGTRLLGVSLTNGIATVNLTKEFESGGGSLSMGARLAQVVYTVTQFPTVEGVLFALDGELVEVFGGEGLILDGPRDRSDFEAFTPAIFVEAPAVGDTVSGTLRVWGTANTFEAAFMVTLRDADGEIVFEEPAMATSGTGTRGTFDLTFDLDPTLSGDATLIVWESSAKDGQPINVVEIPIIIGDEG
ncbi:MAG: hypothetical protein DCC58_06090 [Chloroflexi bacterium]|nr:MAG: hypothetical protein DCC58_06090 [Chloroflexota bacterium]